MLSNDNSAEKPAQPQSLQRLRHHVKCCTNCNFGRTVNSATGDSRIPIETNCSNRSFQERIGSGSFGDAILETAQRTQPQLDESVPATEHVDLLFSNSKPANTQTAIKKRNKRGDIASTNSECSDSETAFTHHEASDVPCYRNFIVSATRNEPESHAVHTPVSRASVFRLRLCIASWDDYFRYHVMLLVGSADRMIVRRLG